MKKSIFSLILASVIMPAIAHPTMPNDDGCGGVMTRDSLSVKISPASKIEVMKPYSRTTAPTVKMGAVFLELHNDSDTDDVLERISTPIAKKAQIHETTMDSHGMASMHELTHGLTIKAHQTVKLAPGGYHIMLMGLTTPALTVGQQFPITLYFNNSRTQTVTVTVKNMPMKMHHHH